MIHDEWTRNVLENRKDLNPEAIARTRQLMDAHVREAVVENFEHLIPAIVLPDPDDRHVVAAAMHARAELIITFNRRDFPAAELQKIRYVGATPRRLYFRPVRPECPQGATGSLPAPQVDEEPAQVRRGLS
jgi:hypothetical protein